MINVNEEENNSTARAGLKQRHIKQDVSIVSYAIINSEKSNRPLHSTVYRNKQPLEKTKSTISQNTLDDYLNPIELVSLLILLKA